jgi:hypothetical protein
VPPTEARAANLLGARCRRVPTPIGTLLKYSSLARIKDLIFKASLITIFSQDIFIYLTGPLDLFILYLIWM